MPVDGIRVDEDDVARIVRDLCDPNGPAIVLIGAIPSEALAHWPDRTTDHVVITRRQRDHYLDEHPEMAEFEEALVRTLLDPEQVHVATGPGDTAALFGRQDDNHDINVVVALSNDDGRRNSVITARRQRATRKFTESKRRNMVWGK